MTPPVPWDKTRACGPNNAHLFFATTDEEVAAAKAICAGCPCRTGCLDYAMALPVAQGEFGVWGGTTAKERRTIARRRRKPEPAQCGTHSGAVRHYQRGETPCAPCLAAKNAYRAERRKRGAA